MKILNWIILAGTFFTMVFAEVKKDQAKYRDALKADATVQFDFAKAVPRWLRGAAYGMMTGTSINLVMEAINSGGTE